MVLVRACTTGAVRGRRVEVQSGGWRKITLDGMSYPHESSFRPSRLVALNADNTPYEFQSPEDPAGTLDVDLDSASPSEEDAPAPAPASEEPYAAAEGDRVIVIATSLPGVVRQLRPEAAPEPAAAEEKKEEVGGEADRAHGRAHRGPVGGRRAAILDLSPDEHPLHTPVDVTVERLGKGTITSVKGAGYRLVRYDAPSPTAPPRSRRAEPLAPPPRREKVRRTVFFPPSPSSLPSRSGLFVLEDGGDLTSLGRRRAAASSAKRRIGAPPKYTKISRMHAAPSAKRAAKEARGSASRDAGDGAAVCECLTAAEWNSCATPILCGEAAPLTGNGSSSRGPMGAPPQLSRAPLIECNPATCPMGDKCQNRCFAAKLGSKVSVEKADQCGWGLRRRAHRQAPFVVEALGELISEEEAQERLATARANGDEDYYMLAASDAATKGLAIDADAQGQRRAANHSCDPSCRLEKWRCGSQDRYGIFALRSVKPGEQLTYDYRWASFGGATAALPTALAPRTAAAAAETILEGDVGDDETAGGGADKDDETLSNDELDGEALTPRAAASPRSSPAAAARRPATPDLETRSCWVCKEAGEIILCKECNRCFHSTAPHHRDDYEECAFWHCRDCAGNGATGGARARRR
ncbi:SET domain-containing protein [Aureococcus anophagefferens]|nr:SET domain-containing protein [Aureococcus anophagefferens]